MRISNRVSAPAMWFVAGAIFAVSPATADTVSLGLTGGNQSFSTYQPALALTPLIQTSGQFEDVGSVRWFGGSYAPEGFALADGSELDVSTFPALFSKIGTVYGGDGRTTYKLPDLRGRAAIGAGGTFNLGQTVGSPQVTLATANLPSHSHTTSTGQSSSTGSGMGFDVKMPALALDYEIVTGGVYATSTTPTSSPDQTLTFVTMDAATDGDKDSGPNERGNVEAADGEIKDISSNDALFSQIGTFYGGNGRNDFALPDLQDKLPVGSGDGPLTSDRRLGSEINGMNGDRILTTAQMPAHTHTDPNGNPVSVEGGTSPVENLQDEVVLTWLVATQGVFPARSSSTNFGDLNDPMLGELSLFAGSFAPRGWAIADGSLLAISSNQALFALFGTNFGGDGRTTFGLPDLRGRTPIGAGTGIGLPPIRLGQMLGLEDVMLTVGNLPEHGHTIERASVPAVPLPAGVWLLLTALGGPLVLRRMRG